MGDVIVLVGWIAAGILVCLGFVVAFIGVPDRLVESPTRAALRLRRVVAGLLWIVSIAILVAGADLGPAIAGLAVPMALLGYWAWRRPLARWALYLAGATVLVMLVAASVPVWLRV